MKSIILTIIILLPFAVFSQTADQRLSNKAPENKTKTRAEVMSEPRAVPQTMTSVQSSPALSEEEQHKAWLENNKHIQTMTAAQRDEIIRELEQKLSFHKASPSAIEIERELKWIKEIQTQK